MSLKLRMRQASEAENPENSQNHNARNTSEHHGEERMPASLKFPSEKTKTKKMTSADDEDDDENNDEDDALLKPLRRSSRRRRREAPWS